MITYTRDAKDDIIAVATIKIDNFLPEDVNHLQHEIIDFIQLYNYNDITTDGGCPFYHILQLLRATLSE